MKPTSLRCLVDDGLLFEINRRVLHPLGLALALQWDSETAEGEPNGVLLLKDSDTGGTIFETKTFEEGAAKYRAFLERDGDERTAARQAAFGFVEQSAPVPADPE